MRQSRDAGVFSRIAQHFIAFAQDFSIPGIDRSSACDSKGKWVLWQIEGYKPTQMDSLHNRHWSGGRDCPAAPLSSATEGLLACQIRHSIIHNRPFRSGSHKTFYGAFCFAPVDWLERVSPLIACWKRSTNAEMLGRLQTMIQLPEVGSIDVTPARSRAR